MKLRQNGTLPLTHRRVFNVIKGVYQVKEKQYLLAYYFTVFLLAGQLVDWVIVQLVLHNVIQQGSFLASHSFLWGDPKSTSPVYLTAVFFLTGFAFKKDKGKEYGKLLWICLGVFIGILITEFLVGNFFVERIEHPIIDIRFVTIILSFICIAFQTPKAQREYKEEGKSLWNLTVALLFGGLLLLGHILTVIGLMS